MKRIAHAGFQLSTGSGEMMIDASPVYLSCQLETKKGREQLDIVVDERQQSAILTYPKYAVSGRYNAVFSPDTMTIRYDLGSIAIDRTSMKMERVTKLPLGKPVVETGTCEVSLPTSDRKF